MPVLVLRPEPGCSATVAAAQALGLDARAAPLFAVEPRDWTLPDVGSFDALLVGSANAFRHGGAQRDALRGLPVLAVGEATAEAARTGGFTVAKCGSGGLQGVLDEVPAGTQLLRLAGEERIELTAPAGVSMAEVVVYASVPRELDPAMLPALRAGALVLLHSAEAARHFASECARLGIDRAAVSLATIGPRVTTAAGDGWRDVQTADQPSDAALLALARRMCQS
ncbi:uroporphyrinogen-III synthase [Novosphingobium sp.]|uniref:uroporphyrinogen-III synthase n=1 Tax=Novosphingobium sp. TaxID=1874826 RepID=UPI00286E2269|nr:uroporphyrinogen-III synthase [Novosphingobium sp.]